MVSEARALRVSQTVTRASLFSGRAAARGPRRPRDRQEEAEHPVEAAARDAGQPAPRGAGGGAAQQRGEPRGVRGNTWVVLGSVARAGDTCSASRSPWDKAVEQKGDE